MPQRILAITTLLVLSVACRDGPTMIDGSAVVTAPANAAVSVDQLSRVRTLMDDLFVRELVARKAGVATIDELDAALKAVGSPPTDKEILAAWHALNALRVPVAARTGTGEPGVAYLMSAEPVTESLILQDVFDLLLDDAMIALLNSGDGS